MKGFKKGDRVQFTNLWLDQYHSRPEREREKRGTVTGPLNGREPRVSVRWDGLKVANTYHEDFIEIAETTGGKK